jgi:hypothetical protein
MKMSSKHALAGLILLSFTGLASASTVDFTSLICSILSSIVETINIVVPTVILIMLLFGVTRYALAADNPGGRKQAKDTIIQSLVGGMIYGLWWTISNLLTFGSGMWTFCPGVAVP